MKKPSKFQYVALVLLMVTIVYTVVFFWGLYRYECWLAEETLKLESEGWFATFEPYLATPEGTPFVIVGYGIFIAWVTSLCLIPREGGT